ncbi:P-loop containing nucleoside triphosphate hydrolase protein [Suillus variegatus]|nr:P-loop containing nucleoside triphosphate hydrolase protein [Suillus variegatus]
MRLTFIASTGLPMPRPDRMLTGYYTLFKRLMSIFKSEAVRLEIRASYESKQTLDQSEVVCAFDTTFKQLLAEGGSPTLHSDVGDRRVSLELKAGGTNEKNIVVFGEAGSGKSSIINTIAQKQVAKTSNDAVGCTLKPKRYTVDISGHQFALFDTAGLNEGSEGNVPDKQAKKQLKRLLKERMRHKSPESDGIDLLLVYCVRRRNTISLPTILDAYNTVYSGTCRKKKVPIVVVVTGFESETHTESWWDAHRETFNSMHPAGHACVTTTQEYLGIPADLTRRVAQSSEILRDLIVNTCSAPMVDDNLPVGTWCCLPLCSMN